MGYNTDFLGHITISPGLNAREIEYLVAFSDSRRWDRPGGPYTVPDNPRLDECDDSQDIQRFNSPAEGQPSLHCQWVPCPEGCCLSWDGIEKFYEPTQWLTYLIEHFLAPGARAEGSGVAEFNEFSFNHRLDGVIVACRRDTRRMWAIHVDDSVVTEVDLQAGLAERDVWGPFPYEREIDARRERRQRRRKGRVGAVIRPAAN